MHAPLHYCGVSVQAFIMLYLRDVMIPGADAAGDGRLFGAPAGDARPQYYTSLLALVGQFVAVLVALPMGKLSDSWGRRGIIAVACLFIASAYLLALFAPPLQAIIIIACLYGTDTNCLQLLLTVTNCG